MVRNRFHVQKKYVYGLDSVQLGETNGFRAADRFRVSNEIITAICKLTAVYCSLSYLIYAMFQICFV
jgi:hypothetical protein